MATPMDQGRLLKQQQPAKPPSSPAQPASKPHQAPQAPNPTVNPLGRMLATLIGEEVVITDRRHGVVIEGRLVRTWSNMLYLEDAVLRGTQYIARPKRIFVADASVAWIHEKCDLEDAKPQPSKEDIQT